MNKIKNILAGLLVLSILLSAIKFLVFKPKNVLGADVYFGLNEGYGTAINDNNGNASGTISNAIWKQEELCKVGKCLYFDGTGDLVSFGDDADLDFVAATNFTVEGWFRTPDITSGQRTLVAKYNPSTGTDGGYKVYIDSSGYVVFGIDDDQTSFPEDSASTTSTSFDDNKWHHFAAVKTGTTSITIYVDGIQYQTDSSISSTGTLVNTDTFYIGIDEAGTTNGFSGFIDEIKGYGTTARTGVEVKADLLGETPSRGATASFGPDQSYLTNGLIGYWKLDETASPSLDISGNGNSGTWTGLPSNGTGRFGNSINLSGTSQYVSLGDKTVHDISLPFSISSWINMDQLPSTKGTDSEIISKYAAAPNRQWTFAIGTDDKLYFWKSHNGTNGEYVFPTGYTFTSADVGVWRHVAVAIDLQGVAQLFVNGNLVETGQATNLTIYGGSNANVLIGARDASSNYFDGRIDEARIYNRALSPVEVSKLYNWAPGPVGHWKFDEQALPLGTVFDSSGYGNNGTAGDASDTGSEPPPATGYYGGAYSFTDDHIDIAPSSSINNLPQLTASTWIYPTDPSPSNERIIGKDAGSTGIQSSWRLQYDTSTRLAFIVNTNNGGVQGTAMEVRATTPTLTNVWSNVAVTWDGTLTLAGVKIYHNGIQLETTLFSSPVGSIGDDSALNLCIGNRCPSETTSSDFKGRIDNVMLYNYQRTTGQIVQDMNAGHPAPGSPVGSAVAKWKFDTGYGTTAYDNNTLTGGAEDLTFSTASWTNSGKFGKAWNGDGSVWLSRANDSDLDFSASESFTLSGWFKTDSATNPANGTEYILSTSTGNTDVGYQVYAKTDGTICFAIDDDGTWTDVESCTATDFYDNTWHNFVAVRNVTTDTTKIYIDGREMDSDTDTTTGTLDGNNVFYIGDFDGDNNATANTEEFAGDIDEVQIFRSALTNSDILLLYSQSSSAVMGSNSTDSSGNASWSSENEYCPPRSSGTCTAPIAEWKMDENTGTTSTFDSSTNGYTGTMNGSMTNSDWVTGKFGSALDFDGSDDSVTNATTTIFNNGSAFTISAWINPRSCGEGNTGTFFTKADEVFFYVCESGVGTYNLGIFDDSGAGANSTNNSITLNAWQHVTAVHDGSGNITLYVNGNNVTSDTTATMTNGTGGIHIGSSNSASFNFDGGIDEVRLYNYARTPAQVAWDYNRGKPVGWWKMDETSWTNDCSTDSVFNSSYNPIHGDACPASTGPTGGASGKFNNAGDFDGTNDYVTMGDAYDVLIGNGSDFSVAGWFNRDTFTTDDTIVGKRATQLTGSNGFLVWVDDADKLTFEVCDANGASCDEYMMESTSLFDATTNTGWNHFAVVWDDDNESGTTIYINGKAESVTRTCTASGGGTCAFSDIGTLDNSSNFNIGAQHDQNNPFDGKIDDIMIFGYALNEQQIKTVMQQSSAVKF